MRIFTTAACLLLVLLWSCNNFEDASDPNRDNFIHIFEGQNSLTATDLLIEENGYLILGNMQLTDDSIVTVIVRTDLFGNELEIKLIDEVIGTGKTIKKFSNPNFTGYLIFGDYDKINPDAEQVGNISITSARLIGLNENLEFQGSLVLGDTLSETPVRPVLTDFTGTAMTITDDGRVVLIANYKPAAETQRPWVVVLDNNFQFDAANPYKQVNKAYIDWEDPYLSLVKDCIPGKSVHSIHSSSNYLIWTSSILRQTGSFNDSYIDVRYVEEPKSPENVSSLDFSSLKLFKAVDIQPASTFGFGYGIVGTFGDVDGTHKNMFFTKVYSDGTINSADTIFIDAYNKRTLSISSQIEDTGEAITSTFDGGFVIAGTMLTGSINGKEFGNGGRDILVAKIDISGNVVWIKTLGGSGDEVVSSIRETSDNGLLISGTNNIGGYASIFLIKTDKNGELKK
jgi:hypothetical protein